LTSEDAANEVQKFDENDIEQICGLLKSFSDKLVLYPKSKVLKYFQQHVFLNVVSKLVESLKIFGIYVPSIDGGVCSDPLPGTQSVNGQELPPVGRQRLASSYSAAIPGLLDDYNYKTSISSLKDAIWHLELSKERIKAIALEEKNAPRIVNFVGCALAAITEIKTMGRLIRREDDKPNITTAERITTTQCDDESDGMDDDDF
jgi:hypothetical protein